MALFAFTSCKKTGLKNINVNALHMKVPVRSLPLEFSKQAIKIDVLNASELRSYGISERSLQNSFNIPGYDLVNTNADFILNPIVGTGTFDNKGIITETTKDTSGVEHHKYYVEIDYGNNVAYTVSDNRGRIIDEVVINNRAQKSQFQSQKFSTLKGANSWWRTNGNKTVDNIRRDLIEDSINKIKDRLYSDYGYFETSSRVYFKTIKDKENRDFRKFATNDAKVQTAFKTMSTYSVAEYKSRIMSSIDFWLEMADKYRGSDEKVMNVKFACLYNVALAYFWMDDFENAIKYSEMIGSGLYNLKDGDRLLDRTIELRRKLREIGLDGQHFEFPFNGRV